MRVHKPRKPIEVTCIDCGDSFTAYSTKALRCPECRLFSKRNASRDWKERNRRMKRREKNPKLLPKMGIGEVLRELDRHNKENKKHLSYGQFVAMMEGGEKNEG